MKIDLGKIGIATVVCFVAIVLIGQAVSYSSQYYCEFDIDIDGDEVSYDIDSNLSLEYTAVSLDNGNRCAIERYVAFYDMSYPMTKSHSGISTDLHWLEFYLKIFGIELILADATEVTKIVTDLDITTALIFITGTFPSEIYSGTDDSLLFNWLAEGGTLYWGGEKIGNKYSVKGEMSCNTVNNYSNLFFGVDNAIRKDTDRVFDTDITKGSLTDIMGIYFNECTNGIDTEKLIDAYLEFDYEYEGYRSAVSTKYYAGDGTINVFGGEIYNDTAASFAHMIASQITYDTAYIDHVRKDLKDPSGTLKKNPSGATDIFIYMRQIHTTHGHWERIPA